MRLTRKRSSPAAATTLGDFGVDFAEFEAASVAIWLDREPSGGWHGDLQLEVDMQVLAKATVTEIE